LVLDFPPNLGTIPTFYPRFLLFFWFFTQDPASTTATIEVRARGY
jgi:hypothetical protein